jgi:hypothetical protein
MRPKRGLVMAPLDFPLDEADRRRQRRSIARRDALTDPVYRAYEIERARAAEARRR